mmetsp:Transcript_39742/g.55183  ORF Transcript_39742/g.55183 Transcript_39742/m.55183 type:complete len:120 (+) Transcript_39742:49-408(+)|eukprot:CAMPEP_0196579810 /NCGR_PEP_ID=MMETSP1081-20130531/24895_1 /TAXON_ID=36882 /ORGANISM="Pyramimonas amylifera, Strain CCMP720" /LENGTH=119 /DNA_ID=CAMNT_0041899503 /DNA_START=49 /DNA_END=408 /DNA_ORIENTATION=+
MAEEDDIFEKFSEHFFMDDTFASKMEEFMKEHCDAFADDEEQKLEYTTIYGKYQELFDQVMKEFLESQGVTVEQFHALCTKVMAGEDEERKATINMFLAVSDYDVFLQEMQRMAEEKRG